MRLDRTTLQRKERPKRVTEVAVTAEITGVVIKVAVTEGQTISAGDTVLLMESMKMEIPLTSSVGGRVRSVTVQEGQTVMEGDVCCVVEAE